MAVTLSVVVLIQCVVLGQGAAFLEQNERSISSISVEEVEDALMARFKEGAGSPYLKSIEDYLRPMYAALPKTPKGGLSASVVRYAVHRYFAEKHGWYMKGLEPTSLVLNSSSDILKDKVPAFIQSLFDKHLHGRGLQLHEVAVFTAALSDLVHAEAYADLLKIFRALSIPTGAAITRNSTDDAIRTYFVFMLYELDMNHVSPTTMRVLEKEIPNIYPAWGDTAMWMKDFRHSHDAVAFPRRNPFVGQSDSFEQTLDYLEQMNRQFGTYQKLECATLKDQLVQMEHQGTGRVRLSKFYSGGLKGDWTFAESVDYLRYVGALDDTDPNKVSVIIPNYITSQTNCLTGSGFYSICCADECEVLMQKLETGVGDPVASTSQVMDIVSQLSSDTVFAPRNISEQLKARLDDIAQFHGGSVPLHGRLFSQWMHHAYPRECPFPHVGGKATPMSPEEWMVANGINSVEASHDEMVSHHNKLEAESGEELNLPWTLVEELVDDEEISSERSWLSRRNIMAVLAIGSLMATLMRAMSTVTGNEGIHCNDKLLV